MRFLVDECTGPHVASWLVAQGHDVYSVFAESRGMDDESVIRLAHPDSRSLITNDKDFGEKVFRDRNPHHGVISLRLDDERTANKIEVLKRLLESYSDRLENRFVVVTETAVRFATT